MKQNPQPPSGNSVSGPSTLRLPVQRTHWITHIAAQEPIAVVGAEG
jgi:hypothetical protein